MKLYHQLPIVMLEDDASFCHIIKDLLKLENQFVVIEDYQNIEKFKNSLNSKKWSNVAIFWIDLHLPDGSGIDMISEIKFMYPMSKCLVCTYHSDDEAIFSAIKNGADGYILKDNSIDQINFSLKDLINEGAAISPYIARKILQSLRHESQHTLTNITKRENEVLLLLSKGLLYKEISVQLNISLETTKKHISNIYQKLHVQNRTEALLKFLK